jgi:ElaB/YqjD/DUF883 family membrane-anchored ribosome-binding protein
MENGGSGVSELKHGAGDIAQDVQDRIEIVRGFARERPVAAIAIAAGIGFVLGRLLSRT